MRITKLELMKKIVSMALCLTVCLLAYTQQQWRFRNFDTRDGLSHNHVNCLFTDSRGFLWIGTEFGLNRFDGVAFVKWFHIPEESTSILNNKIIKMAEDRYDQLWISTEPTGILESE